MLLINSSTAVSCSSSEREGERGRGGERGGERGREGPILPAVHVHVPDGSNLGCDREANENCLRSSIYGN